MRLRIALLAGTLVVAAGAARAGDPPAPVVEPPVRALERLLRRPDWLSRALAAKELGGRSEDGVVAALSGAVLEETDPRVTALLLRGLRGRPRQDLVAETSPEFVDRLIPLVREGSPAATEAALEVLARLSGEPASAGLGPQASWWMRNRRAHRAASAEARARRVAAEARGTPPAPGESVTAPTGDLGRYALLERIHREGLEVMICFDSTGSMSEEIAQAKASVARMVARLRSLAPRFRVGLVTYDDEAFLRLPLTSEEDALADALDGVFAQGGGDAEEGVDRAILLALRQDRAGWSRKAARAIVVVGDAPPHEDDVGRLLGFLEKARADPDYESPVRIDTISAPGGDQDAKGFVLHFSEIARRGGGSAVRLGASRSLASEIVSTSFGPRWRTSVLELLSDLEAIERAEAARADEKPGDGGMRR